MRFKSRLSIRPGFIILILIVIGIMVMFSGQEAAYAQGDSRAAGANSQPLEKLSNSELDKLVGPIALYPDDLLAHVLPASTVPLEIVQAARYLKEKGGKIKDMPDKDWDPSVKALLHFPDVLYKMDKNISWTEQFGSAVVNQNEDVVKAIQRFRKLAYDAGNLKSGQQQSVNINEDVIVIQPTQKEVIYVPQYQPDDVIYQNPGAPLLTFATGVAVGNWFGYRTWDWRYNRIVVHPNQYRYYNYRPGNRYYHGPAAGPWRPTTYARTHARTYARTHARTQARTYNRTHYRTKAGTYAGTRSKATPHRKPQTRPSTKPRVKPRTKPRPRPHTPARVQPHRSTGSVFSGINNTSRTRTHSNRGSRSRAPARRRGGGGGRRR